MKKIATAILSFASLFCFGKNYYVSSTVGNDSNSGLSKSSAWKSLAKVNASQSMIAAGDSVLFRMGDTFVGFLNITKSGNPGTPIIYDWYFDPAAPDTYGIPPIISGFTTITGWTNLGGNIWEANTTGVASDVNLVTRGNVPQQVGRYPNTDATDGGYLTYTASSLTSITGPALSSTTNWTGAQVAVRLNRWEIRKRIVTSHSGGTVNFATIRDVPKLNYGYFFQRDSRTLDRDGEWYQNGSTNKLRMYFSNNNPNAYTIKASTVDTLFKTKRSHLTVNHLHFTGSDKAAMSFEGATGGIRVNDCAVYVNGGDGIVGWFSLDVVVRRCSTDVNLSSGIRLQSYNDRPGNLGIYDCTVNHTALIAGMERSDLSASGHAVFIKCFSDINAIGNVVKNSGYNGIYWYGNNARIANNWVDTYCSARDDGAGIYTYEGPGIITAVRYNRKVVSNIVGNAVGAPYGVPSLGTAPADLLAAFSANGIYNDEGTSYVDIDSNTIYNVPFQGIFGNGNTNIRVRYNTFYNCAMSHSWQRLNKEKRITGMVVENNIFHNYRWRLRDQAADKPTPMNQTQIAQAFGSLNNNHYATKTGTDTSLIIQTADSAGGNFSQNYRNMAYVKGTILREVASINVGNNGTLEYNPSSSPKTVSFPGLSKKDVFNNVYNNLVIIPAWSSKVLYSNGSTTVNIPPNVSSGTTINITLPVDSVFLTSTSSDDGTIVSYSWTKKSGPGTPTIDDASAPNTKVYSLVEGTYQFQIIVTDDGGLKDTAIQVVNVAPAIPPANTPPTADAGSDQTVLYPNTSTSLTAIGTDAEGPVTYLWNLVNGPNTPTIVSPTSATTSITGMVPGDYNFQITVTDDDLATAVDVVKVTVTGPPVNSPPVAFAGNDTTIYLPSDSAIVVGTGSDNDGTIVSYLWEGPGVLETPNSNQTKITGLTLGIHIFTLTVTDNQGGVDTDTVSINVITAPVPSQKKHLYGWKIWKTF